MDKLSDFFSKTGSILRDIFLYFIPAIPFAILLFPILKSLKLIDLDTFSKESEIFYQPIIKEISFLVIIYLIGRLLNALSYLVFYLYNNTVKKIGSILPKSETNNWFISCDKAENSVKEKNEYVLYAYAIKLNINVELFLERNMYIGQSEKGLSTGFFIITILILFVPSETLPIFYKGIYSAISLFISILFYYMYYASMFEYYEAFQAIEKLAAQDEELGKKIKTTQP